MIFVQSPEGNCRHFNCFRNEKITSNMFWRRQCNILLYTLQCITLFLVLQWIEQSDSYMALWAIFMLWILLFLFLLLLWPAIVGIFVVITLTTLAIYCWQNFALQSNIFTDPPFEIITLVNVISTFHKFSQSIRDRTKTPADWYETKPSLCYFLPHVGLGIHNRWKPRNQFIQLVFCPGLVPVVCLIFLNTKIYLAMKNLRYS